MNSDRTGHDYLSLYGGAIAKFLILQDIIQVDTEFLIRNHTFVIQIRRKFCSRPCTIIEINMRQFIFLEFFFILSPVAKAHRKFKCLAQNQCGGMYAFLFSLRFT